MKIGLNTKKNKISTLLFFSIFIGLLSQASHAQVSGTVFKDFNMDGTKGTASPNLDVGMAGAVVNATKPDGTALTVAYTGGGTSTNNTGAYSVTGGTLGQIRLEFILPDAYTFASSGATGGTTILFPAAATQNLAVNYPADYTGIADPLLVTSCYVGNNAAGMNDVMVKYAYSSSGATHSPSHTTIGIASQMGSTWGIGYDRENKNIYTAAFVKRHIPLKDNNADGKEDIGAIYKIPNSGSPSLWLDVTTLGIDVGMASMPTIAARALPIPATTSDLAASHDTQVYPLIGKIGLGDVEISDDNKKLFFVNLFDSKVYTVDIATKTLVGSGIAVPSACTGGVARPFALSYHRGKVYVGVVCDAATSKLDADMKATVYRLDGSTFTSILSFPLNYTKGAAFTWGGIYGNKWNPWEDNFSNVFGFVSPTSLNALCEPQPMLSDILFDTDESLILIFNDRLGHQTGTANYQPSIADTQLYYGVAAGDILRASLVAGVYTLEKNASSGGVTTAGAGNSQGPGTPTATGYTSPSGEFYVGDDENNVHQEVIGGGAAIVPGRGQVAVQVSDPAQNYFAAGTYLMNNITGEYDQSYVVFIDPSSGLKPWLFGKANGLGDLEVMSNNAPIEIGNRVWTDTDNDGIQDAGESPISGVIVTLCLASAPATVVTTATTDASGNYFFSSATGTNTASAKYGVAINFNANYILKFPTTSGALSISTKPNTGANDLVDSDADATGKITFTTGYAGENNHSFDVAYATAPPCTPFGTLTATATPASMATGGNTALNVTGTGITSGITTFNWVASAGNPVFSSSIIQNPTISNFTTANGYSYTVTATNSDGTGICTATATTSLTVSTAAVTCTAPTFTGAAVQVTCTGTTANTDGKLTISGLTNGDKVAYSTGSTYSGATTYSTAPLINTLSPAGQVVGNLANPSPNQPYTIRVYNGSNTCYTDQTVTLLPKNCTSPCGTPACGTITATVNN